MLKKIITSAIFLFLAHSSNANNAETPEIMSVDTIRELVSECTEEFNNLSMKFKEGLTEDQKDRFIDAMYSLERLTFQQEDPEAIKLYEYLANRSPFNHPQFLGEW